MPFPKHTQPPPRRTGCSTALPPPACSRLRGFPNKQKATSRGGTSHLRLGPGGQTKLPTRLAFLRGPPGYPGVAPSRVWNQRPPVRRLNRGWCRPVTHTKYHIPVCTDHSPVSHACSGHLPSFHPKQHSKPTPWKAHRAYKLDHAWSSHAEGKPCATQHLLATWPSTRRHKRHTQRSRVPQNLFSRNNNATLNKHDAK